MKVAGRSFDIGDLSAAAEIDNTTPEFRTRFPKEVRDHKRSNVSRQHTIHLHHARAWKRQERTT
jgi:hypothetical protein